MEHTEFKNVHNIFYVRKEDKKKSLNFPMFKFAMWKIASVRITSLYILKYLMLHWVSIYSVVITDEVRWTNTRVVQKVHGQTER